MHRCSPGSVLSLAVAILMVVTLAGCLGKSTNTGANGGVESVALSPGESISIDVGTTPVSYTHLIHRHFGAGFPCVLAIISSATDRGASSYRAKCIEYSARPWVDERMCVA